ncbi:MAG: hypothetical protein ACTSRG_18905 [Candidatus Helarchaeota archaeon]
MNEKKIFQISNATNIENWYELLKEYTMDTRFIPISIDLANAIIHYYSHSKGEGSITHEEENILKSIEEQIDKIIKTYNSKSGAFVRSSTRSPKDSRIARSKTEKIFKEELKKGEQDENSKLIAIVKSQILGLKVRSGKEALDFLLSSQRIYDDLIFSLEHAIFEGFTQKIFIREWIDIPINMEFRGFV